MKDSPHRLSRTLQWVGWDRGGLATTALFTDEAVWLLAIRKRPLRITALGRVALSPGVVRKGELRLVSIGADALRVLREHLVLGDLVPLTVIVDPVEAGVDAMTDTVRARVDKHQLQALVQCAEQAGFGAVQFDARPAAAARFARLSCRQPGQPLYVGGAGWMSVSAGSIRNVVPGGSIHDQVSSGPSPSSMIRIARPDPVKVADGITLDGPWPVLLGGALASAGAGPNISIEASDQPPSYGWVDVGIDGVLR